MSAAAPRSAREVEIAGRRILLTNEAKVLYPAVGFTKGDLVRWVLAVAPALLPRRGRSGKVDWRQNEAGRSLVAPWSLRAATVPLVATPVVWSEVEGALQAADEGRLRFSPGAALERLGADGDLHVDVLRGSARLPG